VFCGIFPYLRIEIFEALRASQLLKTCHQELGEFVIFVVVVCWHMKIKTYLTLLLLSFNIASYAQTERFMESFMEFSTSRLWEFEPIPISWKMNGLLQADLNEGLNALIENNPSVAEQTLTTVINKDAVTKN
jgi:hypothetical protein